MYEEREDCKSMEYADLFVFIGEAHLKFGKKTILQHVNQRKFVFLIMYVLHLSEDNDKAMEYFQDSLAIYHSVLGEKHAIGSKILTRIGECFIRKRKHKDALVLLEEALQIHIDAGNDFSDLGLAEIQFNLGIVYCETGNLDEAMNSYEKSLKIRTKYLGENSVETAQVSIFLWKVVKYSH
jgi:tetratricopeptide (TPR) repeat protein